MVNMAPRAGAKRTSAMLESRAGWNQQPIKAACIHRRSSHPLHGLWLAVIRLMSGMSGTWVPSEGS